MFEFITIYMTLFLKYIFLFVLTCFFGRSFVILIARFLLKDEKIPDQILQTKNVITYPIIGLVLVGNLLIFINFFIELKSIYIYLFLSLFLLPNLYKIKKLQNFINLDNFIYFIFIPAVLLISSSDINFHYDAAYYHLNHQNWLRESNLIIGFVNVFWPFGMSSVYEYLSSVLWLKDSLIYLHFLSLIFLHFFFSFLYFQLFKSRNNSLKYSSLFILVYALLDNFGINGGRNGFLYIQEIGKQDIAVAVLFCFLSIVILDSIIKSEISNIDITITSLIVFFIFELKVSGVFIFYLFFVLIFLQLKKKKLTFSKLLKLQLPTIFFGVVWTIKSILTTACIIYPLTFTCFENFSWYEKGSTERVEAYTTSTSFAFMEYFQDPNRTFIDWFNTFFNSENSDFSNYYRSVYLNFIFSLVIIYLLKKLFLVSKKNKLNFKLIILSFIFLSLLYLVFYGPIPRYSVGILCSIIALLGFTVQDEKIKIPNILFLGLFIISLALLPRINSYFYLIENSNFALFDPRIEPQYQEVQINENWIKPDNGDRCWINLRCTMEPRTINIDSDNFYKVAYKTGK